MVTKKQMLRNRLTDYKWHAAGTQLKKMTPSLTDGLKKRKIISQHSYVNCAKSVSNYIYFESAVLY